MGAASAGRRGAFECEGRSIVEAEAEADQFLRRVARIHNGLEESTSSPSTLE